MGDGQDLSMQDIIEYIKDDIVRYTTEITEDRKCGDIKYPSGVAIGYRKKDNTVWVTSSCIVHDTSRVIYSSIATRNVTNSLRPGLEENDFISAIQKQIPPATITYVEGFDVYVAVSYADEEFNDTRDIEKKITKKFFPNK